MTLRSQLTLSGLAGVASGAALMGGTVWLLRRTGLPPLIAGPAMWALLGLLLLFSLAEIPLMIFGMRRMAVNAAGRRLAALTNVAFTFFAAVYATPFLLLTGKVSISLVLAGLCLVRFGGALLFVPSPVAGHLEK
jgi:hypothetical protein